MSSAPRRAMRRWAWRTVRRDRRQHLLVVGLVTVAVAVAVLGSTAAYNLVPDRSGDFGDADHRIEMTVNRPAAVAAYLADARGWFGDVEVIGHRSLAVPGSTATVDLRTIDAAATLHGSMVSITGGRAPSSDDEVALTDGVAARYGVGIGDGVDLDGSTFEVVGIVENAGDLDDEFAWVPTAVPDRLSLLVGGGDEQVASFRSANEPGSGFREDRSGDDRTTAAILVVVVAVVAMVLVALVAGASFTTLATRRLRQLGVLAAVGASPRQQRQAVVGTGVAVGAFAAVVGTAAGLAGWLALAPSLEGAAGHRIDRFAIPLWLLAAGAALAVATATVAAWWPARSLSRVPITDALAARPPRPRQARRSTVAAVVALAVGVAGVKAGIDPVHDDVTPVLLIAGVVAIVVALLLLSAPTLRTVASLAGRAPVGVRLALRDLARYESRSAAALGAIALSLAIAVSVVVVATAAAPDADEGNLAADELVVWRSDPGRFDGLRVEADPVADADGLTRIEALAPGATAVAIQLAVDPAEAPDRDGGRHLLATALLGRPVGANTIRDSGLVYVATPELLDHLGVDPSTISTTTELLTRQPGMVYITGDIPVRGRQEPLPAADVMPIDVPDHTSAPRTLITEAGMTAAGLVPYDAGWLLTLDRPLDADALASIRDAAADAGLSVEVRDGGSGRATVRGIATAAGMLLALAILAMTIGLLRSDAARDVRTLTAAGASRRVRRTIAAATGGVLAGVGALLAVGAAYAALLAGYWPDRGQLSPVPVVQLAAIVVGLPVLATAAAWLLGGAEPASLGRTE